MDKKVALTACVCAAFIIASAMLIVFYNHDDEDNQLRLVARVNTEGSGIYVDGDEMPADYATVENSGEITYHKDNWGGKIFGTPGTTSIQHMQMQTLVTQKLGLKFSPYTEGGSLNSDTVYYIPSITNAAAFTASAKQIPALVGGIIWEPQFSKLVIENNCKQLLLTSQIEPGHTCCVIGASHDFLENNSQITVRFLAAYAKTVDAINDAKADHSSDAYKQLIDVAKKQTGIDNTDVIENALGIVNYTATDRSYTSGSAPLSELEDNIEDLAIRYSQLGGVLKNSMSDIGFSSEHSFAQTFVDDGYLNQALNFTPSEAGYNSREITISYISGDIHTSLALGYGQELGIFEKYGIEINAEGAGNGAGVATSLQNGEADFGFMGAPPITITSINSGLVQA